MARPSPPSPLPFRSLWPTKITLFASARGCAPSGTSAILASARANSLCNVSSYRVHIHRVKRLAGGHKQPVTPRTPETDVGAVFRQTNHADGLAVRCDHLHARPRSRPNVPIDVATNAVGGGRPASTRNLQLDKTLAVAQRFAVDVINANLAPSARVADVNLLVIRRKADAVRLVQFVRHLVHLSGFPIHAIHRFFNFRFSLEPFVIAANADRK